jgi:lysophospholipase L1-like esterase
MQEETVMLLTLSQMQAIVRGAVCVTEEDGYFFLRRFTERQANAYRELGEEGLYRRTLSTAGIRLALRTNSKSLSFSYKRIAATSRQTAYFDVYEDGLMTAHFGFDTPQPELGRIDVALSSGEHEVEVYFPWEACFAVKDVTLEGGATVKGVNRKKRLLAFGDSITQGVYSHHPSLCYACRLADLLNADLCNKGIGGDMVRPELLCEAEPDGAPDLITVAYGTNDWGCRTREEFLELYTLFIRRVTALYPGVPVFAITPVWRADWNKTGVKMAIPASEVEGLIREACRGVDGVRVISGWKMIPAYADFYYDGVHPNDLGFGAYAANLYREISRLL